MYEAGNPKRPRAFRSDQAMDKRIKKKAKETGYTESEVMRRAVSAGLCYVKRPKPPKQ